MTIDAYMKDVQSVVISGHVKPDGDCIGSVLALYNYLGKNYPEIETDVYLEESSGTFRFLKGFDKINSRYDKEQTYDLFIALDCSTRERLGEAEKYFETAGHTLCLDHHVSNEGYADENYIYGDMSSACEVLYGFLDPEKLDKAIAECLYTGIVTDTGVFKYSSTSPDTMRIAAALMEFGLNTNWIIDEAFYAKSWNENRILGYALTKSVLDADGQIVYSVLSQEEMERFGVTTKNMEGIVSQLRLTRGVTCAFFMYECGPCQYKVSFRTDDPVDGNVLASIFGGGGHVRASGCTVCGEPEDCLEAILIEARKQV